jgi:hypothetical protein
MRKINKLAAAIAVAVGVGAASTANAVIELKPNGLGDALLFPIYHGYFENYFTISNMANEWIQGHLRFRGAAWSGEVRDFDVILSPGDVMVFRLADLDGDGQWEIDQSLDPLNFKYTGMYAYNDMPFTCKDSGGSPIDGCMEMSTTLIPEPNGALTEGIIEYQKQMGYVEFIGEAVLDGMTHEIMNNLLNNASQLYQTRVFNKRGTTAWAWSDAGGWRGANKLPFEDDEGLSDVPNMLSGTAFLTPPGSTRGLAYNAEVFVNFRTATRGDPNSPDQLPTDEVNAYHVGLHRIDNYRVGTGDTVDGYDNGGRGIPPFNVHPNESMAGFSPLAENRAIIVHDENGAVTQASGTSPAGDYVYWFNNVDNRLDEARISFNNTWGPTLADGDDYLMTYYFDNTTALGDVNVYHEGHDLRWVGCNPAVYPSDFAGTVQAEVDDWDCRWSVQSPLRNANTNSIAEVEEAIREAGQMFTGYYMDNDVFDKACEGNGNANATSCSENTLTTQFLAFFPTKFFYGESAVFWGQSTHDDYLNEAIQRLLAFPKDLAPQIWDITEHPLGFVTEGVECISPSTLEECFGEPPSKLAFHFELQLVGVDFVKEILGGGSATGYEKGRAVFDILGDPITQPAIQGITSRAFPALMYAFEWDQFAPSFITHWRSLNR